MFIGNRQRLNNLIFRFVGISQVDSDQLVDVGPFLLLMRKTRDDLQDLLTFCRIRCSVGNGLEVCEKLFVDVRQRLPQR
ncbi:hypothetical protein N826_11870 [Skermanella aerolata KACC 11604]|nr:hypothetical protein N826_11870 [Skermanella aerolata KACC 11604]